MVVLFAALYFERLPEIMSKAKRKIKQINVDRFEDEMCVFIENSLKVSYISRIRENIVYSRSITTCCLGRGCLYLNNKTVTDV